MANTNQPPLHCEQLITTIAHLGTRETSDIYNLIDNCQIETSGSTGSNVHDQVEWYIYNINIVGNFPEIATLIFEKNGAVVARGGRMVGRVWN